MIELELKAPVPPERLDAVRAALGTPLRVEAHADLYFQHPCRDLATSDEAVRLSRRGGRVDLTYKGPKLDGGSKARREVVVGIADEAAARAFLESLGFAPAAEVRKTRAHFLRGAWSVALDDVPPVGWFVEVERLVPEDAPRAEAEAEGRALLASWGLERTERASYLELLRRHTSRTT